MTARLLAAARAVLLASLLAASLASLAGCKTIRTEDGDYFTAIGIPWALFGKDPSSWFTQNLGEVILGCTGVLAGGSLYGVHRRKGTPGRPSPLRRGTKGNTPGKTRR